MNNAFYCVKIFLNLFIIDFIIDFCDLQIMA